MTHGQRRRQPQPRDVAGNDARAGHRRSAVSAPSRCGTPSQHGGAARHASRWDAVRIGRVAGARGSCPASPDFREVTIPAGTSLSVKVLSTLASNRSIVEDPVRGALAQAVVVSGKTALPVDTGSGCGARGGRGDAKKGGIGAGLGAVVGGIAGGGSGAAIGAVAGGAGTVLATKGREVEVPAGTVVTVLVQKPLTVRVPIK